MICPSGRVFTLIFGLGNRTAHGDRLIRNDENKYGLKQEETRYRLLVVFQSVKTVMGVEEIGFDGGKKVKGRKRTILVDTMGLLLDLCVHGGKRSDHQGMELLATFASQFWTCLKIIWVDSTFAGKDFIAKVEREFGWKLEHVKRTDSEPGFSVIPKRWVVERTYSWFSHYRRLSKDYEFLPTTSEVMIFACMIHIMVRRLEPQS